MKATAPQQQRLRALASRSASEPKRLTLLHSLFSRCRPACPDLLLELRDAMPLSDSMVRIDFAQPMPLRDLNFAKSVDTSAARDWLLEWCFSYLLQSQQWLSTV